VKYERPAIERRVAVMDLHKLVLEARDPTELIRGRTT
jgi:hypothetical protein